MNRVLKSMEFTFSSPSFGAHAALRSAARIISYAFFIIVLGLIVALALSEFIPLRWLGGFVLLIALDALLHVNRPPYSLFELAKGRVPKNNLALCMDRTSLAALSRSTERARVFGGSTLFYSFAEISRKPSIEKMLTRLDVSPKEFHTFVEKELTRIQEGKKEPPLSRTQFQATILPLVRRAAKFSVSHSFLFIDTESVFVALSQSDDLHIARVFDFFGISADDIAAATALSRYLFSSRRLPHSTGGFALRGHTLSGHRVNRSFTSRPTPILDKFSVDVTDMVRAGGGGFLIGHDDEYERLVDVLSRPGMDNALLVGEPGVGKETIVYRLAFDILADKISGQLFDKRVVQLSLQDLMAGATPEELSQRTQDIANEISSAGNIVLYLPDIHTIAKGQEKGEAPLADMLIPILRDTSFPVIGDTHPQAYQSFIEARPDFADVFEEIRVKEILPSQAIQLLVYDAMVMEKTYHVAVSFMAVKKAVELAKKYVHTSPLPSSAQGILREAIADATQRRTKMVHAEDIVSIVERKVSVPIHDTGKQEAEKLLHLEEHIHTHYIDQEEAVSAVADALRAYRSGLSSGKGPIATFLFVGPTGVGKTELSKIVADIQFGSRTSMERFDMSEYQQKSDVVRFIGSPDGKIAGALTESVMHDPYSLVLLDEFEKAHPDILQLFLQVFDDGRLTDGLGRVVDFSNTVIIATSNAESVLIQEKIRSGADIASFSDDLKTKLATHFRPELLNRFSRVVVFKPLSLSDIEKIALLKLGDLSQLLNKKGIDVLFDKTALARIARLGYDPSFGARPLDRAIQENLTSHFSRALLSGEIIKGAHIKVVADANGKLLFEPQKS